MARRSAAVAALPEFEQLRDTAARHQEPRLANLDFYLEDTAEGRSAPAATSLVRDRRRCARAVLQISARRGAHRHEGQIDDRRGARASTITWKTRHHADRNRSRRIHHPASPRTAAAISSRPAFHLNREDWEEKLPQMPYRPASRPGVQRTPRHPDRSAHPAARTSSSPPMSASPAPIS